jgi:hypothetical protein
MLLSSPIYASYAKKWGLHLWEISADNQLCKLESASHPNLAAKPAVH